MAFTMDDVIEALRIMKECDDAELRIKFMDCARPAIGAQAATAWWDELVGAGVTE